MKSLFLALAAGLLFAGNSYASPVLGSDCSSTVLPGDMKDTRTVMFYGGELAQVTVHGDGFTNLDVFIYDENGNLIVSETSLSDDAILSWTPRWTGNFRIVVVNQSDFYSNAYTICVG
jgi:hypothetical protein